MKGKIAMYRKEGRLALKHMWIVVVVFAVIQVIVSIAVAAANTKAQVGGHSSASFAAIWSMFMAIIFAGLGGYVVLSGKSSELLVGFLIGVSTMMAELFFVLMAFFFTLGEIATTNNYTTAPSDKAYAAFSLFNMIIYFVWSIILTVHRKTIMVSQSESQAKEFSAYDGTQEEVYNPAAPGYHGEQEEL